MYVPPVGLPPLCMSENESGDNVEQAIANLQREVMAMRQILMLLLAHHARHSAEANALGSLKDLLDEVYSSDADFILRLSHAGGWNGFRGSSAPRSGERLCWPC